MNRIKMLQAAGLIAVVVLISSCSSGRNYHRYPPPPPAVRTSVSLIIPAGPGLVVTRYRDGRYFYRSPQGYMYWRGAGNRYYLDRRYVRREWHSHRQYRDWRRGYRRR